MLTTAIVNGLYYTVRRMQCDRLSQQQVRFLLAINIKWFRVDGNGNDQWRPNSISTTSLYHFGTRNYPIWDSLATCWICYRHACIFSISFHCGQVRNKLVTSHL